MIAVEASADASPSIGCEALANLQLLVFCDHDSSLGSFPSKNFDGVCDDVVDFADYCIVGVFAKNKADKCLWRSSAKCPIAAV